MKNDKDGGISAGVGAIIGAIIASASAAAATGAQTALSSSTGRRQQSITIQNDTPFDISVYYSAKTEHGSFAVSPAAVRHMPSPQEAYMTFLLSTNPAPPWTFKGDEQIESVYDLDELYQDALSDWIKGVGSENNNMNYNPDNTMSYSMSSLGAGVESTVIFRIQGTFDEAYGPDRNIDVFFTIYMHTTNSTGTIKAGCYFSDATVEENDNKERVRNYYRDIVEDEDVAKSRIDSLKDKMKDTYRSYTGYSESGVTASAEVEISQPIENQNSRKFFVKFISAKETIFKLEWVEV